MKRQLVVLLGRITEIQQLAAFDSREQLPLEAHFILIKGSLSPYQVHKRLIYIQCYFIPWRIYLGYGRRRSSCDGLGCLARQEAYPRVHRDAPVSQNPAPALAAPPTACTSCYCHRQRRPRRQLRHRSPGSCSSRRLWKGKKSNQFLRLPRCSLWNVRVIATRKIIRALYKSNENILTDKICTVSLKFDNIYIRRLY